MEQLHRTALQNGIPSLYHYETFNPTYLAQTLRDNVIHCSNPVKLNDPWDCKPAFDPRLLDNPELLEREMEWRLPHPAKHLWEAQMRADPKAREDFLLGASKWIEAMLAQRRIYCMTPRPASTLMWSHYAHNHRGVCLEFNVASPPFRAAAEVRYREDYPRWLPCEINDNHGRVMELILTKSDDWSYEEEYRLVSVDEPPSSYLHAEGDYFRLPGGALKSVIIGCQVDKPALMAALIRECAPGIAVKKAVRSPNLYKLAIVDYLPA